MEAMLAMPAQAGEILAGKGVHKYGANLDVDGAEDLWIGGGTYDFASAAEVIWASSDDDTDVETIVIQGLDANWDAVADTVVLTGQTEVSTGTTFIRVNRAYNISSDAVAGTVYIFGAGASSVCTVSHDFIAHTSTRSGYPLSGTRVGPPQA
jgi:hypothetical protein